MLAIKIFKISELGNPHKYGNEISNLYEMEYNKVKIER